MSIVFREEDQVYYDKYLQEQKGHSSFGEVPNVEWETIFDTSASMQSGRIVSRSVCGRYERETRFNWNGATGRTVDEVRRIA